MFAARSLLLLLALALTGACTTLPGSSRPVPNIYVMRHLHTPEGVKDAELTAEGRAHAEALARWFRRDPPAVLYVSRTRRAEQTAAPLARSLGLTPRSYDPADTPALLAAVLRETGTVLVVGHSNTVPDIIAGLGGERPPPLVHSDFADIWRVSGPRRRTQRWKLKP
jgi:broad specificity phosphatase PhoE